MQPTAFRLAGGAFSDFTVASGRLFAQAMPVLPASLSQWPLLPWQGESLTLGEARMVALAAVSANMPCGRGACLDLPIRVLFTSGKEVASCCRDGGKRGSGAKWPQSTKEHLGKMHNDLMLCSCRSGWPSSSASSRAAPA